MAVLLFICTYNSSSVSHLRSLTQMHEYSLLQISVSNQHSIWDVCLDGFDNTPTVMEESKIQISLIDVKRNQLSW